MQTQLPRGLLYSPISGRGSFLTVSTMHQEDKRTAIFRIRSRGATSQVRLVGKGRCWLT